MRNAIFWTLLPILLPQALWVRLNAVRLADADGPKSGVTGAGERFRLVAIGDSIIAGVGATTLQNALVGQTAASLASMLNCSVQWSAVGSTGANSKRILRELLPLPDHVPADAYLFSVGVNDVTSLTTLPHWENNIVSLIEHFRRRAPRAILAFVGLPPMHIFPALPQPLRALIGMRAQSIDERLRSICERYPSVVHVPVNFEPGPGRFSGDGYHPSEASYKPFGKMVASCIMAQRNASFAG